MNSSRPQTTSLLEFFKIVTRKVSRVRYEYFFGIAKLHADSSLSIKNNKGKGKHQDSGTEFIYSHLLLESLHCVIPIYKFLDVIYELYTFNHKYEPKRTFSLSALK